MNLSYQIEPDLNASDFKDILVRSTLAERRPVHEPDTLESMLRGADLILTARLDGRLVGIARSISDGAYCTYLSDLAVDADHWRMGIGRELIRRTHDAAGRHTSLILLSAPAAIEYYQHLGMDRHPACFTFAGDRG